MEYVYKYLDDRGEVAYVGITKNMERRVLQHKADKLKEIKDPTIYYFPVMHRGDAELLETYLIGHYKTGQRYNVSKTKKGDFSFLDIELPWKKYPGSDDPNTEPFQVSKFTKEVVVEKEIVTKKTVYVDAPSSDETKIRLIDQWTSEKKEFIENEINAEKEIIAFLNNLIATGHENDDINHGLALHTERLDAFEEANSICLWGMTEDELPQSVLDRCKTASENIQAFETELMERSAS